MPINNHNCPVTISLVMPIISDNFTLNIVLSQHINSLPIPFTIHLFYEYESIPIDCVLQYFVLFLHRFLIAILIFALSSTPPCP